MLAAAPTGELDQLWQAFVAQYGAFEDVGAVTSAPQPPYPAVTVETAFANATVALTVTVTSTGLVGGLHVAKVARSRRHADRQSLPTRSRRTGGQD